MARTLPLLLLLLLLLLLNGGSAMAVNYTRRVSSLRLARIQRHLDKINKPHLRSIKSPDGDVVDCVHRHRQPALDHPLLQDHKIQTVPPEMPRFKGGRALENYTDTVRGAWQAWHHAGHCPRGTVPIRRSTVDDVLRAKSLYHYGKKQRKMPPTTTQRTYDAPDVVSGNGHEVSPELYGDSSPRLFTYWTSDSYQATGCYNLLCSGFVQTNNKIAIGAAISPTSSYSGSQFDITILIWKDPKIGNWWMSFGDSTLVGYWPAELFTHLADRATMVEWGGEVVNTCANGEHTSTQMGSGHFAEDGFSHASYFHNLEIVDSDNSLSSVQSITTLAENANCYNIKSSTSADWGTYFYYGGPGKNPKCP